MKEKAFTLTNIAEAVKGEVKGDPRLLIQGIATMNKAKAGDITFLHNPLYAKYLASTTASAVIVDPAHASFCTKAALIVKNPHFAYAKVAELFSKEPVPSPGIHPSASIAEDVILGKGISIGPNVVIESGAVIENNAVLGAHVFIGEQSFVGESTRIWPNVTLYHDVKVGKRCIIHSGAVIGSDGFSMAKNEGKWHHIPQIGGVRVGDDVEIGANTTIDRGALEHTVIGDGVKLDNQIQIAHNVVIGDHTAIAGCAAIAGSTTIGKHCIIGGGAGLSGHLTITDNVSITAMSGISRSIREPGIYAAGVPAMPHKQWQKNAVRFRRLNDLFSRVATLEDNLESLQTSGEEVNDENN